MSDKVRTPKILAVIPARGGSKGLPGKNIRPLMGKPLIAHTITLAAQLGANVRYIVSTDDPEIAAAATLAGADVPFLRPAALANDTAPMTVVLRHALETMEDLDNCQYDMVLLLDPTSPTRTAESVLEAIAQLNSSSGLDGVIAVSEPTFNPVWVGVRHKGGKSNELERYFPEGTGVVRRQDVPRFLRINGSFYVWWAQYVRRMESSWFDEGTHGYIEISELRAFSIDDESEFRLVEAAVKTGLSPLPGYDAASGLQG
ncbi:acylneuraminate cytidylyltransferase family protein [Pseudarthrobacter sp. ATCC 49987]|uniref:acylneuraminate cytidylyltransferase family protein n=1 Tax=Pseudarthrobacter sp. ATCC 49987 TaxID=2698204 RepID=UPI0013694134|nr:acylneuraminate cytidylyltransferase family protein [Pseudarthrobacter sp. ATCC 49987]